MTTTPPSQALTKPEATGIGTAVADKLLGLLGRVPTSTEPVAADPAQRATAIIKASATKAAFYSGSLALPPGPMGFLTLLPDLVVIWQVQAQMVADIAAAHGQKASLTREHLIYCLFKHTASQVTRDILVRVGERLVVRVLTHEAVRNLLQRVGIRVAQRVVAKSAARWVPLVGAAAVGAYAYYDTRQVGKSALTLFGTCRPGGSSPRAICHQGGSLARDATRL